MASPQIENGYTKIANELLEALARIRISGEANQILLVILRKTYGFNKTEDAISLSQFHLFTGIKKPSITRAIRKLEELNIINRKANGAIKIYQLNKDYSTWRPLPKKITVNNNDKAFNKNDNKCLPKSYPQKKKDISQKISLNPILLERFERFWRAYPNKQLKGYAEEAWMEIQPSKSLTETILAKIEEGKRSTQWTKDGGEYIPYPAKWLRAKGWNDQYKISPEIKKQRNSLQLERDEYKKKANDCRDAAKGDEGHPRYQELMYKADESDKKAQALERRLKEL
jgi:phage replication O-like protein O